MDVSMACGEPDDGETPTAVVAFGWRTSTPPPALVAIGPIGAKSAKGERLHPHRGALPWVGVGGRTSWCQRPRNHEPYGVRRCTHWKVAKCTRIVRFVSVKSGIDPAQFSL
jgi:hypothetical protein